MTCTYGFSHFRHFQNCCNRDGNTIFKYMNYVPIVVATDLEVHFSVLKKGVSQYFSLYSVCTSHWCLVMSFWLKVCIYSHTRGVKLGLGLGFMQTSQVLPHWLNQSFSFWTLHWRPNTFGNIMYLSIWDVAVWVACVLLDWLIFHSLFRNHRLSSHIWFFQWVPMGRQKEKNKPYNILNIFHQ